MNLIAVDGRWNKMKIEKKANIYKIKIENKFNITKEIKTKKEIKIGE